MITPYSVSRIHAVERSLLDRGKIMQIAEAKTVSDALRMIYDAGYKHEEDYEASFEAWQCGRRMSWYILWRRTRASLTCF